MIYELHTSTGQKIRIDDDDLKKIEDNAAEFMVKLKQGIVRPPFISVIVPTNEKETKIESIIEKRGDKVVITGEREVKVLKDLMTLPTEHDQLPAAKNGTTQKQLR
jgi:signal peptidase I